MEQTTEKKRKPVGEMTMDETTKKKDNIEEGDDMDEDNTKNGSLTNSKGNEVKTSDNQDD